MTGKSKAPKDTTDKDEGARSGEQTRKNAPGSPAGVLVWKLDRCGKKVVLPCASTRVGACAQSRREASQPHPPTGTGASPVMQGWRSWSWGVEKWEVQQWTCERSNEGVQRGGKEGWFPMVRVQGLSAFGFECELKLGEPILACGVPSHGRTEQRSDQQY